MLLHFPLSQVEIIPRSYGRLYRLSDLSANLKNLQVLLQIVEPLGETSKHSHPVEEVFYIIQGEVIFRSESQEIHAGEQDTVIVPPDAIHQVYNPSTDEPAIILIAISPPRRSEDVKYY